MADVLQFPAPPDPERPIEAHGLNLTPEEVREAAGGYKRPKDQLRELHARGFVRAHIAKVSGRVVLERAHYEAVTRGQFGPAANDAAPAGRNPVHANIAGLKAFFKQKRS